MKRVRIATYARNSSEEQRERQTIDRQRHLFREFLSRNPEYELVETYEDEAVSGAIPLDQRPSGRRLLADLDSNRFDMVLVTSLDRFGRTLQVIVDGYRAIESRKGSLYVLDSPLGVIDTTNPMGKFAFHLLAIVAELERDIIRDRTYTMRRVRAQDGKWMGGRYLPYGYDLGPDGRLVINQEEATIIREIAYRRVSGESWGKIADDLNRRGVPFRHKNRNGVVETLPWTEGRVRDLLVQGRLTGKTTYGDLEIDIPPILDERLHRAILATKKRGRKPAEDAILSGTLRCAMCGSRMYAIQIANRKIGWSRRYYICEGSSNDRSRLYRNRGCKAKDLPVDLVDTWVLEEIERALQEPERWWAVLATRDQERQAQAEQIEAELKALQEQLDEAQRAYDSLLDLYNRGRIDYRTFDRREPAYAAQIHELEREIRVRQLRLQTIESEMSGEAELAAYLHEVRQAWDSLTLSEKKKAARRFVRGAAARTIVLTDRPRGKGYQKEAIVEVEFVFGSSTMGTEADQHVQGNKQDTIGVSRGF